MIDFFNKEILSLGTVKITFFSLFIVLLILATVRLVAFFVRKFLLSKRRKKTLEDTRFYSVYTLVKYVLWVTGVCIALEILGFDITLLMASSAALLIGVGFALKDTFRDIISGIIVLVEGTINIDDVLEINGEIGRVSEINLRTSKIYTTRGVHIILPNSMLITEPIVNWSAENKATRFFIEVGVSYLSDVQKVRKALLEVLDDHSGVIDTLDEKPMQVMIKNFGDSSIDFRLYFWTNEIFFIERVKSELRYAIVEKFKEYNIQIPFPQRDLHIIDGENKKLSNS